MARYSSHSASTPHRLREKGKCSEQAMPCLARPREKPVQKRARLIQASCSLWWRSGQDDGNQTRPLSDVGTGTRRPETHEPTMRLVPWGKHRMFPRPPQASFLINCWNRNFPDVEARAACLGRRREWNQERHEIVRSGRCLWRARQRYDRPPKRARISSSVTRAA